MRNRQPILIPTRLSPYWLALGVALAAHALVLTLPWRRTTTQTAKQQTMAVALPTTDTSDRLGSVTPQPHANAPKPATESTHQIVSTAPQARPAATASPSRRAHKASKPIASHPRHPAAPIKVVNTVKRQQKVARPSKKATSAKPHHSHLKPLIARLKAPPHKPSNRPPAASRASENTHASAGGVAQRRHRYRTQLENYLAGFRHYPLMAKQQSQQGRVILHFVMDRQGHVLSKQLKRRTPFPLLNHEALALLTRAQPLPSPPPALVGNTLAWTLPINFKLH